MGRGTSSVPASGIAPRGMSTTAARPALPAAPYLVVGLGRAGAAAARALAAHADAAVRVWDALPGPGQLDSAAALRPLGIDVRLGGDGVETLDGVRTVVKSPGFPWEAPVVAEARRRRLAIVDELDIGWRLTPAPT